MRLHVRPLPNFINPSGLSMVEGFRKKILGQFYKYCKFKFAIFMKLASLLFPLFFSS